MRHKVLLVSSLAVAGVVALVIISAVTVFALGESNTIQDTVTVDKAVEVAPVQAEPVGHSEVVKPVLRYESAGHAGKAGCRYSSKLQLTEAPAPARQIEDESLAQVQQ